MTDPGAKSDDLGDWFRGDGTLNVAHRGASGYAPENTLPAFTLAAEMGADGIELDIHLSADGEAVVIHNDTVDATTNGYGRVSQMTLSELVTLDAGSWFDTRFAGARIPTLAQVFEAVGQRLLINVEIKVEAGYHPVQQEMEAVRLIQEHHMAHRVIVSSFSPSSLRRVHKLDPNIALGFLYAGRVPVYLLRCLRWLGVPYHALHPAFGSVDAAYVAKARQVGQQVNVWTVNVADDMRRMRDLGVDSIITNYPDLLGQILAER
jgi:glycerophosphoryl diester phosphodiesterase